jgi:hypothetical protein
MEGLDKALGNVYGFIEQNFLQVDVEFYDTHSDTYRYWTTFRNIANIVFVILFLIVILSQVTSVGISNYGIKKMLPEIITAALLINLSYFICQAMVDLSNIVGVSIRDLLGAVVGETDWNAIGAQGGDSFLAAVTVTAGVALVGFSVTTILSQGIFGLILAFLLVLLVAAVALLMMFVILIARQIGVILLIVLAPLAFAARILPNTQNLFKKWWSAFASLLVVYPMCSMVIGLGAAAAAIIGSRAAGASADPVANLASIFTAVTSGNLGYLAEINLVQGVWIAAAVLATVAPYFAVISLSKSALNGLGKLGGMITGKVAGAGAGINKLGRTGASAAQKKYDQSAGRQATLNARANRNKEKVAKAMADNRGVLNKLSGGRIATTRKSAADRVFESEFNAERTKDEMQMVNLGEYSKRAGDQGYDENLAKQSRANAIRLGHYQAGGAAYEADLAKSGGVVTARMTANASRSATNAARIAADPNGSEAALQAQAKTAVAQQEAKHAKQLDEQFDVQITDGKTSDMVASTHNASGVYDALRAERAINAMIQKGDIEGATNLTRAYTASAGYKNDRHAQQRLANVLKTGETKKSAAHLHAMGHQIQTTLKKGDTAASYGLDDFAKGTAQETNLTTHATAAIGDNLNGALQNNYNTAEIGSQDKDTFKYLAGSGANFSDSQYANVLTSGKTTKELNALLPNIDDSTHIAEAATARAAGNTTAAAAALARAADARTRRNSTVAAINTDSLKNLNEASFETLSKAYGGGTNNAGVSNDTALIAALSRQQTDYAALDPGDKTKFAQSLDPKVKARMSGAGFVF